MKKIKAKKMKKFRKNVNIIHDTAAALAVKRANKAVTNIVGTILLLSIAVSLTTGIYILVLNTAFNNSNTPQLSVTIIGTIEGDRIILEHRGGNGLSSETEITFIIGDNNPEHNTSGEWLENDTNGDGFWSIGERVVYNNGTDLMFKRVEALVFDVETQSIVMRGVIQEGKQGTDPWVITLDVPVEDIFSNSATLWMEYHFRNHTVGEGEVKFRYKPKQSGSWTDTPKSWVDMISNHSGTYNETITSLLPNTEYQVEAYLRYREGGGDEWNNSRGGVRSFMTGDIRRGIWHFDDFNTPYIAFDSSDYHNHGDIYGGATWMDAGEAKVGDSALSFDGVDDYVEVPHRESLDLTNGITMETWVKPLEHNEGIVGKINDTMINTSEFGVINFDCYEPDLIHIFGDIYAIACRSYNNHGFVITVEIADNGTIKANDTTCIIDTLEFETEKCVDPNVTHVYKDRYVIAYRGPDDDGWLKTVQIRNNGQIGDDVVNSSEFDSFRCFDPAIIHINSNATHHVYAIAYEGQNQHGQVSTVRINNFGVITDGPLSTLDFYNEDQGGTCKICGPICVQSPEVFGTAHEPDIILIDWDAPNNTGVFVIVYADNDYDLVIRTVKINSFGGITQISHSYGGDSFNCFKVDSGDDRHTPDIIRVDGDYYAIAYTVDAGGGTGRLITMEVFSDGTLNYSHISMYGHPVVNSFVFSTPFYEPKIILVNWDASGSGVYAIVYRGSGSDGWLKTVEIFNDGEIEDVVIDSLEFEWLENGLEPSIICVNNDVYAIAYTGKGGDGILKTITIENSGNIPNDDLVINAHELGIFNCYESNVLHISGEIYAIAYRGLNDGGWIKTVRMADNGSITNTFIDTFTIEPGRLSRIGYSGQYGNQYDDFCYHLNFTHVSGNIYAIVYYGPGWDLWVKTVEILDTGEISFLFEYYHQGDYISPSGYGSYPNIIHVSGDVYAIAYKGYEEDGGADYWNGKLKTISIDSGNGDISNIDDYRFEGPSDDGIYDPDIILVNWDEANDGGVFAIAYENRSGKKAVLATVNISDQGIIIPSVISTLTFDYLDPGIIHVNGSFYAIAYRGFRYDGWLKTVEIADNGSINQDIVDELEFDDLNCLDPNIIQLTGRVFAVIYEGDGHDGWLKTFRIGEDGDITDTVDDDKEFTDDRTCGPEIIHVFNDVYAIVYGGGHQSYDSYDLYLKTGKINLTGTTRGILVKEDAYNISANATKVSGSILSFSGGGQILSVNLSRGWSHIVLTYNESSGMKLYHNYSGPDAEVASAGWIGEILLSTNNLKFGEYNAILDEVIIYSKALKPTEVEDRYNENS